MKMNKETNGTMTTKRTTFQDFSDNKETVEVGVIVMGLCCMCLVACALVILQLRSNNRRIMGNRQRPGSADNRSNDRTRDPLDIEAPPSYDAVIRSPHLYPPSRWTSTTLDGSETRRSSVSSTFSLSLHSPRFIHHPRVVPRETSEDTDTLSHHSDIHQRGNQSEDNEEPPPPYPGNVVLITSRNPRSTVYICRVHSRPAEQCTRAPDNNRPVSETAHRSSNRRGLGTSSSQGHSVRPSANNVVNAWTENETERGTFYDESNQDCRIHGCQSNAGMRNSDANQRDTNVSRTSVSHSTRSTSCTLSLENPQHVETL